LCPGAYEYNFVSAWNFDSENGIAAGVPEVRLLLLVSMLQNQPATCIRYGFHHIQTLINYKQFLTSPAAS